MSSLKLSHWSPGSPLLGSEKDRHVWGGRGSLAHLGMKESLCAEIPPPPLDWPSLCLLLDSSYRNPERAARQAQHRKSPFCATKSSEVLVQSVTGHPGAECGTSEVTTSKPSQ